MRPYRLTIHRDMPSHNVPYRVSNEALSTLLGCTLTINTIYIYIYEAPPIRISIIYLQKGRVVTNRILIRRMMIGKRIIIGERA
jgi:hypothetical protein